MKLQRERGEGGKREGEGGKREGRGREEGEKGKRGRGKEGKGVGMGREGRTRNMQACQHSPTRSSLGRSVPILTWGLGTRQ